MRKIVFAFFIFSIYCCSNDKKKPDVSGIKVDVQIERFEQSFFKTDTNNIQAGLVNLRNGFPTFFPVFMQSILQLNPMDTGSYSILRNIISGYWPINDSIQKKYPKLDWLEDELEQSFKYVKHYYPQYQLPKVLTFIGTLDAPGAVVTQDYLGIGLHQFGGKDFSVYQDPQVQQIYPSYISRRFDKEFITANAMKAIADDLYPDQSVAKPLIEQMVEKGKQWYLLDHLIPDAADSIKTGYTKKQVDWATENEGNIWGFIIKNENPYAIEPHVIQTYIGESPFTQGMPETSPGNIGQWIGWRIVQQYASKNEKLTLPEILATPARKIFEESKYKPK
jgi:hypothetical protein